MTATQRRYKGRLSQRDVLRLFRDGVYRVDLESGVIYGRNGEPLTTCPDEDGYLFVRFYESQRRVGIMVARAVWMAATRRTIPRDFEIHHRDLNVRNNAYSNLFCLHKDDHRKLHSGGLIEEEPFI